LCVRAKEIVTQHGEIKNAGACAGVFDFLLHLSQTRDAIYPRHLKQRGFGRVDIFWLATPGFKHWLLESA
jgi:hypothetical protein